MTRVTTDALVVCGALLTGAGLLFTFGTAPPPGLSGHSALFLLLGSLVTAVGLALAVWRCWAWLRARAHSLPEPEPLLQPQTAKWVDLPELHAFYSRQFGDDVPSLAQMRDWHSKNPNIFRIVTASNLISGRRKIVASFKAVPLKNVTIAFLELEALTGTSLAPEHIVRPRGRASAWYVGDLVSSDRVSAVAVMRDMVEFFSANLQPDTPVYARGLTDKGLSLLREYQFEPVADRKMEIGRICRLHASAVGELLERIHGARPSRPKRVRPKGRYKPPPVDQGIGT